MTNFVFWLKYLEFTCIKHDRTKQNWLRYILIKSTSFRAFATQEMRAEPFIHFKKLFGREIEVWDFIYHSCPKRFYFSSERILREITLSRKFFYWNCSGAIARKTKNKIETKRSFVRKKNFKAGCCFFFFWARKENLLASLAVSFSSMSIIVKNQKLSLFPWFCPT